MIREPREEDESPQAHVSKDFMSDLRRLYGRAVPVPPQVDEAILSAARARIVRRRRAWILLRRVSVGATAAAAAVGLAVWIGQANRQVTTTSEPMIAAVTPAGPKDIDRNGQVDILDAFMLARHLDERLEGRADAPVGPQEGAASRTKASDLSLDLNGDGVVDTGDVDVVAMAAVSLKGGAS